LIAFSFIYVFAHFIQQRRWYYMGKICRMSLEIC